MSDFKQALKAASDNALQEGQITDEQHGELAEVFGPSINRAGIAQHVLQHSLKLAPVGIGAIDWLALIAKIQQMLPLILQIIELLKKPTPTTL